VCEIAELEIEGHLPGFEPADVQQVIARPNQLGAGNGEYMIEAEDHVVIAAIASAKRRPGCW